LGSGKKIAGIEIKNYAIFYDLADLKNGPLETLGMPSQE
jgi:hypothetical protein